jgi:hypothetical protein
MFQGLDRVIGFLPLPPCSFPSAVPVRVRSDTVPSARSVGAVYLINCLCGNPGLLGAAP